MLSCQAQMNLKSLKVQTLCFLSLVVFTTGENNNFRKKAKHFVTKICWAFLPPEFWLAACLGSQGHSEQTDTRDFLKHVNFGDHPWVCKEVEELDRGLIRSSPRNGIGPISNKNMGLWSHLGHLEVLGCCCWVVNLLLDHIGLTHILNPAVYLVFFLDWQVGDHPKTFLLLVLFC